MAWFAASAIMYLKFKDGIQDVYPVWENVLLIEADSAEEAQEKACRRAKEDEGDSSGTNTWKDRPSTWVFAGLRKLLTVAHPDYENRVLDTAEVTFSEFEITSQEDFEALVNGEDVRVLYCAD
jgi:hypothetical protein